MGAATLTGMVQLLKGARRVYLQGPKVGHGTPIYDREIPRDRTGLPVYSPVWEYLLLSSASAPAGGDIPAAVTPCCCIEYRMGQGLYAPRNCSRAVGATCQK